MLESGPNAQTNEGGRAAERRAFLSLLAAHGHRAAKRLGQNFLWDSDLLGELAALAGIEAGDCVLEIGSGAGSLTAALLERVGAEGRVYACEIDQGLEALLAERFAGDARLELRLADALTVDFARWTAGERRLRVAANIPYNLTTELIVSLLTQVPEALSMSFLVQEEAAERIFARPKDGKAYGPLAILVQAYGTGRVVKRVPRQAFIPAPHVDSVWIHIERRAAEQDDLFSLLRPRLREFARFLQVLFRQRRKTLANNIKALPPDLRLGAERGAAALQLDLGLRAEQLSCEDLARLFGQTTHFSAVDLTS